MNNNLLLSPIQSFCVMQFFLESYFYKTSSDSIGALLSGIQFLNDEQTADPALWEDWNKIVGNAPITFMKAFQAMNIFLHMYFQQTNSINVKNMFSDISLVLDDKAGKERIWQKWIACIDHALE